MTCPSMKVLAANNLMTIHQVLEIRDNKARVIRSRRDAYSELQAIDYI
jgi:hypothetical protein